MQEKKRKKTVALIILCIIFLAVVITTGIKYYLKITSGQKMSYSSVEEYAKNKKAREWIQNIPDINSPSKFPELANNLFELTQVAINDKKFVQKLYSDRQQTLVDRALYVSKNESPEIQSLLKEAEKAGPATSPDKALMFIRKAREIKPDSLAVDMMEAVIYQTQGNDEKAKELALNIYKRLKKEGGGHPNICVLGMVLYYQDQYKYANKGLEVFANNILDENSGHEHRLILRVVADISMKYGDRTINDPGTKKIFYETSEDILKSLLPVADKIDWPDPYHTLGLFYKSYEPARAEKYLLKALDLENKSHISQDETYKALIELCEKLKQYEKCKKYKEMYQGKSN